MNRYLVTVRTSLISTSYDAIASNSFDLYGAALEKFGIGYISVRAA